MSRAEPSAVAPDALPVDGAHPGTRGPYISQFDSFRVIACCAVVLQHSLLWNVQAGNTTAWAFVMLLHFSRTATPEIRVQSEKGESVAIASGSQAKSPSTRRRA